jgi:putative transposase
MTSDPATYPGYRFPAEIISHAIWLYHVFSLSLRDVELILAERGITVTHESIRQCCLRFGADFARKLRRRRPKPGDTWHLDEVFLRINGVLQHGGGDQALQHARAGRDDPAPAQLVQQRRGNRRRVSGGERHRQQPGQQLAPVPRSEHTEVERLAQRVKLLAPGLEPRGVGGQGVGGDISPPP